MTTFLQQLVNGLSLGSIYALIALGYTMVYGVLRLINFAHGDVYMVGAYAGYFLSRRLQGSQPSFVSALLVMLGSMIACAVLGILIERLAYRPVRREARLTLLITAIGVSLFIENVAQLVFGPDPEVLPLAGAAVGLHRRRSAADERADHRDRGVRSSSWCCCASSS